MNEIREEICDYVMDPRNQHWLRRYVRLRVSCRRVHQIARAYLPRDRASISPFGTEFSSEPQTES